MTDTHKLSILDVEKVTSGAEITYQLRNETITVIILSSLMHGVTYEQIKDWDRHHLIWEDLIKNHITKKRYLIFKSEYWSHNN